MLESFDTSTDAQLAIDDPSTLASDTQADETDGFFSLDIEFSLDHPFSHSSPSKSQLVLGHSPEDDRLDHRLRAKIACASPFLATPVSHHSSPRPPPPLLGPIAPEIDRKGNLEYKLKLLPPTKQRFDRLVTQLKWRLLQGAGFAMYEIGVLDDGTLIGLDSNPMKDSLKILSLMAAEVGAHCIVRRVFVLDSSPQHTIDQVDHAQAQSASFPLPIRALNQQEATELLQPCLAVACPQETFRKRGDYSFCIVSQQPLSMGEETESLRHVSQALPNSHDTVNVESDTTAPTSGFQAKVATPTWTWDKKQMGRPKHGGKRRTTMRGGGCLVQDDQDKLETGGGLLEKRMRRLAELKAAEMAGAGWSESTSASSLHVSNSIAHDLIQQMRVMQMAFPDGRDAHHQALLEDDKSIESLLALKDREIQEAQDAQGVRELFQRKRYEMSKRQRAAIVVAEDVDANHVRTNAGYENLLAELGVLSESAARAVYKKEDGDECKMDQGLPSPWRVIVEAVVVCRDVNGGDGKYPT